MKRLTESPTGSPQSGATNVKRRRGVRAGVLLVGVVIAAVVVAACGDGGASDSNPSPTATSPSSSGSPPPGPIDAVAENLPADFEITVYQGEETLGGQEVMFSSLFAEGKPVVLNFWAGLCPPCRAEMPDLQETYDEYGDQVLLFGLDVGPFMGLGSREDGQELLNELRVTYPAGTTFERSVTRSYEIRGMPTTFFIKPNGEVLRKWGGLLTKDRMGLLIQELIAASGT